MALAPCGGQRCLQFTGRAFRAEPGWLAGSAVMPGGLGSVAAILSELLLSNDRIKVAMLRRLPCDPSNLL